MNKQFSAIDATIICFGRNLHRLCRWFDFLLGVETGGGIAWYEKYGGGDEDGALSSGSLGEGTVWGVFKTVRSLTSSMIMARSA
jgi:hypothetical protein